MSWRNLLAKGRFNEAHRALFKAFFEDGRDLGDQDVLVEIGTSVGLDSEDLRAALEQRSYRERVIGDERQAETLGVTVVPTAMMRVADAPLEEAEVIRGAQPYDVLKAAVERAMSRELVTAAQ